ncbi:hypothetical protein LOTGIDRAFT_103318 [Lottia gigantea]|uniref:Fucosyltransferase n=1 Tax=Lottia gigantea TaxID=225164 RepID=V4BI17_LOTGI|nr:hypothetical protein LOTGIDRAFT_103318 [Lottia gigantea]ESP05557.1 hypothetical protein LOTGIDRAFT_103318 [Lottia gigantea]
MLNAPQWLTGELRSNIFDKCEVSACQFHYKEPYKYVNDSDAVIIIPLGYSNKRFIIRNSNKGQIWIFAVWEPPILSYSAEFNETISKRKINWTMTYRLDSDIPVPYCLVEKTSGQSKNYPKIMAEKTKLAAQVVSHCPTPSLREQYVKSLQQYITVMVYGACGHAKQRSRDKHLFHNIENSYKFYLSFENSLCRDYVTEKFFQRQKSNIVPIVRGDGNYEHFYPKNSYIDVRDFKSISDLAKYIQYLDRNDTAYMEYLKAKENFSSTRGIGRTIVKSFCQVCKMLHNPDKYRNIYSNVQDWYNNGVCRQATDLEI